MASIYSNEAPGSGKGNAYSADARWWLKAYENRRHEVVTSVVGRIWNAQSTRREQHLRHARLYGNLPILGLGPRAYARRAMAGNASRLAFNVVKNCSDAYTAKITKDRPKVTFVTSGGDYELQKRAEQLDKFVEGQFYELDFYEICNSLVQDTAVFGTAIVKIFEAPEGSKLRIERVFPWEILVDDEESVYGEPRNIYQRKYVDRVVLQAIFPEAANEIATANREENDIEEFGYDSTSDQVVITECWHLPSSPDAGDGRHCIVVGNATLLDEPWDKPYFPFEILRRQKPLVGWWGIGLAEELIGIQIELNVLLQKIQRSHHLLAAGHWLVENGSKINTNKIDNEIGSIIRYTGTPPTLEIGQAVNPEVYQHLDRLYSKAYEITGISQLSAQSQKPAGLDSGKALRVYSDIETERFKVCYREYEHFVLRVARRLIDLAREIGEKDSKFGVKATSKNAMQRILWKDVHLDEDEYVLKLYPTNALANDPASRIAQVQEFANAGWVDAADAKRLLDFPDLEAFSNLENASYNLVMEIIEGMKRGEYVGPEPYMDLQDGVKRVQLAYLKAKLDKVPEENLELFRRWMTEADGMLNQPVNDNGPPVNDNGQPPQVAPNPAVPPGPEGPPPGAMQ